MKKEEDIVSFDFQGWPVYKMNVREIIEHFGGTLNETTNNWEIPNDDRFNLYPSLLEDDGMGYGVNEEYITEVNLKAGYCTIFHEPDTIKKIWDLYDKWVMIVMVDSTSRLGTDEKKELIEFCKIHIEEFKIFAKRELSEPKEHNYLIAGLCDEILPEISNEISEGKPVKNIIDELKRVAKNALDLYNSFKYNEWDIFSNCNKWLNYFNGTKDVDYYKDYVKYKKYLNKHYISWKPNEEDDPNPTYEEFVNNKENYKI